jgi:hypothetical protein
MSQSNSFVREHPVLAVWNDAGPIRPLERSFIVAFENQSQRAVRQERPSLWIVWTQIDCDLKSLNSFVVSTFIRERIGQPAMCRGEGRIQINRDFILA